MLPIVADQMMFVVALLFLGFALVSFGVGRIVSAPTSPHDVSFGAIALNTGLISVSIALSLSRTNSNVIALLVLASTISVLLSPGIGSSLPKRIGLAATTAAPGVFFIIAVTYLQWLDRFDLNTPLSVGGATQTTFELEPWISLPITIGVICSLCTGAILRQLYGTRSAIASLTVIVVLYGASALIGHFQSTILVIPSYAILGIGVGWAFAGPGAIRRLTLIILLVSGSVLTRYSIQNLWAW
ncbi:MAG: hypothetical protein AAGA22_01090 [Pseudomonadota bacterium]